MQCIVCTAAKRCKSSHPRCGRLPKPWVNLESPRDDAKPEGFLPGGMSLHNMMSPHGPDAAAFEHASTAELQPVKITNTLALMFESRFPQKLTRFSSAVAVPQDDYVDCWTSLRKNLVATP
jgi:homogentisate 1,2-dioxygenase